MLTIAALLNQHQGAEAWVFGKGPSLDGFDMQTAGPLRICINESWLHVPQPAYFFAHDELPIRNVSNNWQQGCRAILQPVRAKFAENRGIPGNAIFTYEKREREWAVLDWTPEKIAAECCLLGLTGTVHSAIHFCRLIGVASLVFVGMDGRGGYAQCIGQSVPTGGGQHDRIRRDTEFIAQRLGLPYCFVEPSANRL